MDAIRGKHYDVKELLVSHGAKLCAEDLVKLGQEMCLCASKYALLLLLSPLPSLPPSLPPPFPPSQLPSNLASPPSIPPLWPNATFTLSSEYMQTYM
jgi:hypothetical protein